MNEEVHSFWKAMIFMQSNAAPHAPKYSWVHVGAPYLRYHLQVSNPNDFS